MKRILILLALFVTITSVSHAQKEKYQSLFIYNFTKYIKWPDSYNSEKFIIGVIGDSEILQSLNAMAASKRKTGNGVEIVVEKYGSINEIRDCNILFVSENSVNALGQIDDQTSSKPVLIVSDTPGMALQGAVINFVEKDGKIKFELNEAKAASRGLIVSSSLTTLAIVI